MGVGKLRLHPCDQTTSRTPTSNHPASRAGRADARYPSAPAKPRLTRERAARMGWLGKSGARGSTIDGRTKAEGSTRVGAVVLSAATQSGKEGAVDTGCTVETESDAFECESDQYRQHHIDWDDDGVRISLCLRDAMLASIPA